MTALRLMRIVLRWTCLALLAALVVTPLAQIVMRGIFNVPMAGAEEMARYFLICLTFVAAGYVTLEGGQIRMEEFQAMLPPRPRWLLQLFIEISGIAIFAILLAAALVSIGNNLQNQTATIEMPFWAFMGPLALGSALAIVETLAMLAHTWRRGRPEKKQTTLT